MRSGKAKCYFYLRLSRLSLLLVDNGDADGLIVHLTSASNRDDDMQEEITAGTASL